MWCAAVDAFGPASSLAILQARQQFRHLERWSLSPEALAMPVHEVEAEQMKQIREIGRCMMQANIQARGDGDVGPKLTLIQDGPSQPQPVSDAAPGEAENSATVVFLRDRVHRRSLQTVFGEIEVDRRSYRNVGRQSLHPLDAKLALPERSFSYEVQRRVTKAAVQGPFDEAVSNVRDLTGLKLSKKSAEDIVVDAAVDFDAFYEQRPVDEDSGPILVAAVDCKGVPMKKMEPADHGRRKKGEKSNKKRMATVAAVYTQEPRVRTPEDVVESLFRPVRLVPDQEEREARKRARPQNKRVWASLPKGKDRIIQETGEEMERRDLDKSKIRVALTDGERALQRRVLMLLPGALLILDLFHVLERLWKAAHVFFTEGSSEAVDYVKSRVLMILQGKCSQVVRGMRQSATKRGLKGQKRKTIDEVTGYLYNNRPYMRYDEYLAQGLPIASGAVEGACKNLIKDRMERSGMRWCELGAEAMLKLRSIYLSGDFEAYWTFHIEQDQRRIVATQGRALAAG